MNKYRLLKLKCYRNLLIELKKLELGLNITKQNNERLSSSVLGKAKVKVLTR